MKSRLPIVLIGLTLVLFVATSLLALSQPERSLAQPGQGLAQPEATPSDCVAEADKSADPSSFPLGQDTGVTLVLSGTCGADPMAVDMVLVVDESLSMTELRGGGGGGLPTERATPGTPGTPTRPAGGGELPTQVSDEPVFCSGGNVGRPSPTPTLRFGRRTPVPAEPTPTVDAETGGQENLIRASQEWVRDFVGETQIQDDFTSGRLRMGFVSFNSRAVIKQPLSPDSADVISASSRLRGGDITRINTGLTEAVRVLDGANSREDGERTKVIVVLSDFKVCQRDISGGGAQRDGIDIVTIAMGRDFDRKKARDLATQNEFALEQRDLPELIDIYRRVLTKMVGLTVQQATVNDELAPNMELVPDSAQPPPTNLNGQQLQWLLDTPVFPMTFTYRVRPLDAGLHSISAQAGADWTDSAGRMGRVPFPDVQVDVLAPTSTPTLTPVGTNTPTATAEPPNRYFPIAYNRWPEAVPTPCVPEEQVLDVALIIDTSTSMSDPTSEGGRPKLTVAIEAVTDFVNLLKPSDQAAVIGFNATATVASGLTSDKAALSAALQSLPATQSTGTSIDVGLRTGLDEVLKTVREPDTRSIILVTDGQQTGEGGVQGVRDAAAAVRAAGIQLVTVGLGRSDEIDETLLREIASSPELYFPAPDAEDLLRIYDEIVHLIPCS